VAEIDLAGETVAVAENPVINNATYIIRESLTPGSWKDLLELPKATARQAGAIQVIHRDQGNHLKMILNRLQDLLNVRAYRAQAQPATSVED
jgi:hypothetical protein